MRPVRIIVWTSIWLATLVCGVVFCFPRLELIYPPSVKFECSSDKIPVIGRVHCPDCVLLIGDHTVRTADDGSFNEEVTLRPGKNNIEIYLRDVPGNEILKVLEVFRNAPVPGGSALQTPPPSESVVPEAPPAAFSAGNLKRSNVSSAPGTREPAAIKPVERKSPQIKKETVSIAAEASETRGAASKTDSAGAKRPVAFFINGKEASNPAADYLFKDNHIYIPVESAVWKLADAAQVTSKAVVFHNAEPLKQLTLPLAGESFTADGKVYLPVRGIFERAGRTVNWTPGRVYIDAEYRPCPVDVAGASKKDSINGVIFKSTLFVESGSLAKIGIKAEPVKGGIRLTGRDAAGITVSRVTYGATTREVIIEIRSGVGKSPTVRLTGPGNEIVDEKYLIPLRKVAKVLGMEVKWDDSTRRVLVLPITVARAR